MAIKLGVTAERNFSPHAQGDIEFIALMAFADQMFDEIENPVVDPSQEGFGKDLWWDGPLVALMSLGDNKIENLEPLIDSCLRQVQAADEDKFGTGGTIIEGTGTGGFGVYSKYLPNQSDAAGAISALKKATSYMSSTSPGKFDYEKFEKCFSGTCYVKKNKFSSDTTKGAGFWDLYEFPVQNRGWTKREQFISALKGAKDLIACMKTIQKRAESLKNTTFKDEEKENAKKYLKMLKEVLNLEAHFCRGITVACKTIVRGTFRRVLQKMFGEK